MCDSIIIKISPKELLKTYESFLEGYMRMVRNLDKIIEDNSSNEAQVRHFLGEHEGKKIILQWSPEISEEGDILNS